MLLSFLSIMVFVFCLSGEEANAQKINIDNKIMGNSVLTAKQMANFVKVKNPKNNKLRGVSEEELAVIYIEEGKKEGVRGDVAFAQALKETGYFKFGGDVLPAQNNYTGIGTIGGGVKGNYFKSPREGVRAQIQHLKAYASNNALNTPLVDPRFKYVKRGSATTYPQLHQKWAMQKSGNYGHDILSIYLEMSKTPRT